MSEFLTLTIEKVEFLTFISYICVSYEEKSMYTEEGLMPNWHTDQKRKFFSPWLVDSS